jgi:LysR family malonate utilization transcriptional regulator
VKTVPKLVMGLKLRRSELNIDLTLGSNVDLLQRLKNHELEAILVSLDESASDPACEQLPLFSDDIFLAVPTDSPFAGQAEVDLADLADSTFITLTQGFATHRDGARVFQQAGFEPKVAMQVNDIFTLLSMVSSGVGLCPAARAHRGGVREPRQVDCLEAAIPPAAAHWRGVSEGARAGAELVGVVGRVPNVQPR